MNGIISSFILMVILIVNNATGDINLIPMGLAHNFYEKTCPQVEDIVKSALAPIFSSDLTAPASLLRLMFHDCQVQGCDASILMDVSDTASHKQPELSSRKNFGIRNRESINQIKERVEAVCPKQVSCADIIVLAAREAVAVSGGPRIEVPLGRKDSLFASSSEAAETSLPAHDLGVDDALGLFARHGLTTRETVAIIGAHTLGVTHCVNVIDRLYSHPKEREAMDPLFESVLKLACPQFITLVENTTFVLNDLTSFVFDNLYYRNLMRHQGVLRIDAELPLNNTTAGIVEHFSVNQNDFFEDFASAFVKISYAGVLTGKSGVIRSKCNSNRLT